LNQSEEYELSFRCVAHWYALFIAQQSSEPKRVRRKRWCTM